MRAESLLGDQVRELATKKGIDVVRVTSAGAFDGYLLPASPRRDPHLALPSARTIIVFGIYIGGVRLPNWDDPGIGRTSRLALSGFFSDAAEPLEPFASLLRSHGFQAIICDESRDGGSIMPLKLAAVRAGIGWQGRHSLIISPSYGSFLALGGILTDALFEADDETVEDRCGKCHICRDACPTGALDAPYRLDRQRCLSHLLQRETLPQWARTATGNRVLDCEICQDACPWNRKHLRQPLQTSRSRLFQEQVPVLSQSFRLANLFRLSEREYEVLFGPYKTDLPYHVFRRNVVLALANLGESGSPLLEMVQDDPDPEIRDIAKTSLGARERENDPSPSL